MNNQQWLNFALANMHPGQWFGWKKDYTGTERMAYENIEVLDSSITKPTKAEVNANEIMKNGMLIGCHHGLGIKDIDFIKNKFTKFLVKLSYA